MTCEDCIHNEVCYRREVCNDIEEHIRKLGCMDFIARADVQEIKHGKWIETQEPLGWCDVDCAECSVCHESWIIDEDSSIDDYKCIWHYCPNCGAKWTEKRLRENDTRTNKGTIFACLEFKRLSQYVRIGRYAQRYCCP